MPALSLQLLRVEVLASFATIVKLFNRLNLFFRRKRKFANYARLLKFESLLHFLLERVAHH